MYCINCGKEIENVEVLEQDNIIEFCSYKCEADFMVKNAIIINKYCPRCNAQFNEKDMCCIRNKRKYHIKCLFTQLQNKHRENEKYTKDYANRYEKSKLALAKFEAEFKEQLVAEIL